jgi:hypothetical protein
MIQNAVTQQRAAELLNLPTSTYCRHLATGTDQLAHILWQKEINA